jgi:hypothetical protein
MVVTKRGESFYWSRIRDLFGLPYRDPRIQELFTEVGLSPDASWRELHIGIYAMPPYDKQPSPIAEIDLIPSFRIRFRFKHASLVAGARTESQTTFVFAAVTYFLESENEKERFSGELPFGIRQSDDLESIEKRVSAPPTRRELGEVDGYVEWEDRNPVLHVLYSTREKRPLRVNVFLGPKTQSQSRA